MQQREKSEKSPKLSLFWRYFLLSPIKKPQITFSQSYIAIYINDWQQWQSLTNDDRSALQTDKENGNEKLTNTHACSLSAIIANKKRKKSWTRKIINSYSLERETTTKKIVDTRGNRKTYLLFIRRWILGNIFVYVCRHTRDLCKFINNLWFQWKQSKRYKNNSFLLSCI